VLPLGATNAERVDVRVVCATHRDLESQVAQGQFRGDLLARLRELSVHLPSLRERREDLYPLVLHFLRRLNVAEREVSFPFMLALAHYEWPYNIRELESTVRVAITLGGGQPLDLPQLPENVRRSLEGHGAPAEPGAGTPMPAPPATSTFRGQIVAPMGATTARPSAQVKRSGDAPTEEELRELLMRHAGNIAAVGRELGKERMQVHRWLRRYDIDIEQYRK
jgi:sigma-54 dependent transcriptional regulator, acetoin dehydrogenase operon transcriptional activator AcoR